MNNKKLFVRIGEKIRNYVSVFGRMENEILLGGIGR